MNRRDNSDLKTAGTLLLGLVLGCCVGAAFWFVLTCGVTK